MRPIDADQLLDFIRFDERVIAPEEHTAQDIVMMIQTAPTITQPPNDPLTLRQLREMDGEPVWSARWGVWGLVDIGFAAVITRKGDLDINDEGIHERLYRRKPEERTRCMGGNGHD